jgi:hypothetical protein
MDNFFGFLGAYYLIPSLIIGMIGFILGWFLKPSTKRAGDLSVEGEGALRAEADSLRARVQDLESRVAGRDSEVSDLKTQLAASPSASSTADLTTKTTDADDSYALEWQNRYLAARVKYLDSRLAEMGGADATKPAKKAKATPKKTPTKKAATKKTSAKSKTAVAAAATAAVVKTAAPAKKTAKKPAAKKPAAKKTAAKKPAATKKPAAKSKAASSKAAPAKKKPAAKSDAKLDKYYENVKKYDARASKTVVENIVKYCGVSLRSRDSSLVACSDESELQTVAKGFVTKKLGVEDGQMDLVKSVCEQMKGQRMKSRVTFYYLAAKKVKKLELFK